MSTLPVFGYIGIVYNYKIFMPLFIVPSAMKLVSSLPNPLQLLCFNHHQTRPRRAANLQSLSTSGQLPRSPVLPSSSSNSSSLLGLVICLGSLKDRHNLKRKPQHKVGVHMQQSRLCGILVVILYCYLS